MPLNDSQIKQFVKDWSFKELFLELGWDNVQSNQLVKIKVKDETYSFTPLRQKRDFIIFLYEAETANQIPDRQAGLKIENKITQIAAEHLLIFTDRAKTKQIWQWSKRGANAPVRISRETFIKGMSGERLVQKLSKLFFSIDEEEDLTISDVARRSDSLFRERITRRFYDIFKEEHKIFSSQIEGIEDKEQIDWYASLTLNRLMFVYFIQHKGFLNSEKEYLKKKLWETKESIGDDMFYSFYKMFLVKFFHNGLGEPNHSPELVKLLGKIPYLNGGLFEPHKIETENDIQIKDDAFQKIFDFFDKYDWHLDDRPLRNDNEINPDVLGYIFEKFINQKQMGAYYTKEDITDYISKNTIIPFLFDRVKQKVLNAFHRYDGIWQILQDNPDRYIYDAVKKGVIDEDGNQTEIAEEIAEGIKDVSKRTNWNRTADENFGLPTETWREYVARRQRCLDIRQKMQNGEIYDINDLITYNLDITRFAEDVIFTTESSDVVKAFYHAIFGRVPERSNEKFEQGVTVLDPTCGSGAFLFAALKILEPLLDKCLDRMEDFVEDEELLRPNSVKFSVFRRVLNEIEKHPNRRYFVLKSIIVNNLFGVDIMPDATEICKLRLFLQLVAQVDADVNKKNYGLEPLPDIDFNIRAGNTLVGFANEKEVYQAFQGVTQARLAFDDRADEFKEKAEQTAQIYEHFRLQQIKEGGEITAEDKANLQTKLRELSDELDKFIAHEYGIDEIKNPNKFADFLKSHQPFHWYSEFYGIIADGGFDVIIGNPPYVEYNKVKKDYEINNYQTVSCGNLYANVLERCFNIGNHKGFCGMIVQLPIVCTDRMMPLQNMFKRRSQEVWFSTFDDRPAKLFDGLEHIRATIAINKLGNEQAQIWTTKYNRWHSEARENLFPNLNYVSNTAFSYTGAIPKSGHIFEKEVIEKILKFNSIGNYLAGGEIINFHNAPQYWIRSMTFTPYFWNEKDGEKISTQVKMLGLSTKVDAKTVASILNSTLFYWWFIALSDCRHLNMREIENFPVGLGQMKAEHKAKLTELCDELMKSYKANAYRKDAQYKTTGRVIYDEYYPRYSKQIIDEIDRVLAKHYGFTDEELDFIINYDIKYRMGRASED